MTVLLLALLFQKTENQLSRKQNEALHWLTALLRHCVKASLRLFAAAVRPISCNPFVNEQTKIVLRLIIALGSGTAFAAALIDNWQHSQPR